MYCKKCGTEMQDDVLFCPNCGAEVSPTTSQSEQSSKDDNKQQKGTNVKKPIQKRWWFWAIIGVVVLTIFIGLFGSGDGDQGGGNASSNADLENYSVVIESSRLSTDYEGDAIIIVKYKFTNNDDDPASFAWSLNYDAFQNGIGLNECYFAADSANYSADNQTKEIKKGASLYVEVAYELNDSTTDVVVEVSELVSFSDKKVTKIFSIK